MANSVLCSTSSTSNSTGTGPDGTARDANSAVGEFGNGLNGITNHGKSIALQDTSWASRCGASHNGGNSASKGAANKVVELTLCCWNDTSNSILCGTSSTTGNANSAVGKAWDGLGSLTEGSGIVALDGTSEAASGGGDRRNDLSSGTRGTTDDALDARYSTLGVTEGGKSGRIAQAGKGE